VTEPNDELLREYFGLLSRVTASYREIVHLDEKRAIRGSAPLRGPEVALGEVPRERASRWPSFLEGRFTATTRVGQVET
jgi:hypothetical protein